MKAYSISRLIYVSATIIIWSSFQTTGQSQSSVKNTTKGDYSYFKAGSVSVVPSSHQDIAWMDSIGKCIEFRDEKMITPVLARLKANNEFKFSVEDGLSLREYLQRHPD